MTPNELRASDLYTNVMQYRLSHTAHTLRCLEELLLKSTASPVSESSASHMNDVEKEEAHASLEPERESPKQLAERLLERAPRRSLGSVALFASRGKGPGLASPGLASGAEPSEPGARAGCLWRHGVAAPSTVASGRGAAGVGPRVEPPTLAATPLGPLKPLGFVAPGCRLRRSDSSASRHCSCPTRAEVQRGIRAARSCMPPVASGPLPSCRADVEGDKHGARSEPTGRDAEPEDPSCASAEGPATHRRDALATREEPLAWCSSRRDAGGLAQTTRAEGGGSTKACGDDTRWPRTGEATLAITLDARTGLWLLWRPCASLASCAKIGDSKGEAGVVATGVAVCSRLLEQTLGRAEDTSE